MLSIAVINGAALALLAYIVGTASGVHFFLFAAPAAIVFFGPHHVRVAAFITVCILILFLLIEFYFPPHGSIAPASPALLRGGQSSVRKRRGGAYLHGGVIRDPHARKPREGIGTRIRSI
jgi:MASE7